jgi:hypothetical protein
VVRIRFRESLAGAFSLSIHDGSADAEAISLERSGSDLPTLVPTTPDAVNLTGGVYQVQRNRAAASYLEMLSAPAAAVAP